jgi:hypothetical protein
MAERLASANHDSEFVILNCHLLFHNSKSSIQIEYSLWLIRNYQSAGQTEI